MTKTPYSFSVLRYIHDPVSQEFANIGVAVFSSRARYVDALCAVNYGRISKIFGKIDGDRFRQATRYIQEQIRRVGQELQTGLPFEQVLTIESLLAGVLPQDDSAFQFSAPGIGLTDDLDKTLTELFARFVERYALPDSARRDDEEVWKSVFREPLERRQVTHYLNAKRIVAPNFDYKFEHSWKNEIWHVYEPISFDLLETNSILDKANRWLGRATTLAESTERFKMYVLLGEPEGATLRSAFLKAQNILNKIPGRPEFVREDEAESFADDLAREIREHRREDPR